MGDLEGEISLEDEISFGRFEKLQQKDYPQVPAVLAEVERKLDGLVAAAVRDALPPALQCFFEKSEGMGRVTKLMKETIRNPLDSFRLNNSVRALGEIDPAHEAFDQLGWENRYLHWSSGPIEVMGLYLFVSCHSQYVREVAELKVHLRTEEAAKLYGPKGPDDLEKEVVIMVSVQNHLPSPVPPVFLARYGNFE